MTQREFVEASKVIQKIKLFGIKSIGGVALDAHLDRMKRGAKFMDMTLEIKEAEQEIQRRENEKASKR